MLAIADLLPGGEPSPECRPSRPTGRFRRQPTADSAGKTRNPESPDRPREDCQPSSLAPTRNRDTLIPGKEPGRCNHARQFQQVPGRTEEHGAMLGDEVEVLTGETNERSPLSELLHDELPGKQGVSIAFSPVDDEVEGMIIHGEFPPVDPGVLSEIERQATVCEMGLGEIPFAGRRWSLKPVKSTSTCSPRSTNVARTTNWRILIEEATITKRT